MREREDERLRKGEEEHRHEGEEELEGTVRVEEDSSSIEKGSMGAEMGSPRA